MAWYAIAAVSARAVRVLFSLLIIRGRRLPAAFSVKEYHH